MNLLIALPRRHIEVSVIVPRAQDHPMSTYEHGESVAATAAKLTPFIGVA